MRTLLLALAFVSSLVCDAQAQWVLQRSGTTASLRGIHNQGITIAWASGSGGTVLRTTDGGKNWQRCATPPGADELDFRGVQAFDENTAIVMSSGKGVLSRLYKTTDGCSSWKLVFANPAPDGFFDAVQFRNNAAALPEDKCFGVLLGDPVADHFSLFVTFDCGDTWERQKTQPEAKSEEAAFAASNSALIVGGFADRTIVTGGASGAHVLQFMTGVSFDVPEWWGQKPTNPPPYQINSWLAKALPQHHRSDSAGAFSIAWAEGVGPVIVGGDYQKPDLRDDTAWYWSVEPGKLQFKQALTPPGGFRSAVAFHSKTKTWIAVGPNGTDISTDGGRNWHPLRPNKNRGDAVDADRNWNALSLPFVVGPHGRIGKLRDDSVRRR